MSKPLMIGFASPKVYCWSCKRLTRLKELGCDGLAPCSFCGAPLLEWYLRKIGLREAKEAPQDAQKRIETANPEQEGISQRNKSSGGEVA